MATNTTTAPAPANNLDCEARYENLLIADLCSVYCACEAMAEAARSAYNTPRSWRERGYLSGSGEVVDEWVTETNERMEIVIAALRSSVPLNEREAYERALILLKHEIRCGAEIAEIAAMAATMALKSNCGGA